MILRKLFGIAAIVLTASAAWPAAAAAKKFFGGVVPDGSGAGHSQRASVARAGGLSYYGGPVLHSNRTHLIFWQPSGSGLTFDGRYQTTMERFLADVAKDSHKPTNVYGLSGQYRDLLGPAAYASTYGGSVLDSDPLPPNGCTEPPPPLGGGPGWRYCLSDSQLEDEVVNVVRSDGLPITLRDVYFLVMPNGLGGCEFSGPDTCALGGASHNGYCGYHSSTIDGQPYAVIPYNAVPGHCQSGNPRPNGTAADPSISTISHEQNEVVTDPLENAWRTSSAVENGDLCFTSFGRTLGGAGAGAWNQSINTHHYYLQNEWSNEDGSCRPRDESYRVSFRARSLSRMAVRFAAQAADPDGAIAAYNWSFGDGRTARHRVSSHWFRRPGSYRVALRVTDRAGNWAFYSRRIRVGLPRISR